MTIDHRIGLLVLVWVLYVNGVAGVFHCLTAKRKCLDDFNCAQLLDIATHTCRDSYNGTTCRTLSLEYCRNSMKDLWSNPVFGGNCVCADSTREPECHAFRNFISNHPCLKHPPLNPESKEDFPTCTYAFKLCRINRRCKEILESFHRACKIEHDECRMHNRVKCRKAWENLQTIPVYGCLCHQEDELDRCSKLYGMINMNPCVEKLNNWVPAYWTPTENYQPESDETSSPYTDDPASKVDHASLPHSTSALVTDFEESSTLLFPGGTIFEPPKRNNSEDIWVNSPFRSALHGELIGRSAIRQHPNEITNEPVTSSSVTSSFSGIKAKSTCQRAYRTCEEDKSCLVLLENMLQVCEPEGAVCNRTECMLAVQNFYQLANPSTIRAVTFCICKYNDDECLFHQKRLHPPCAQRYEVEIPSCLEVSNQCQNDPHCRKAMNRFTEACAINHKTTQCQGSLENCRRSIVDILGTRFHTQCACSGSNYNIMFRCIEWLRLLWLNPCIVQAQNDYHENRLMIPTSPPILVPYTKYPITRSTIFTNIPTPTSWQVTPDNEVTNWSHDMTPTANNSEYCFHEFRVNNKTVQLGINENRRLYSSQNPSCSWLCICSPEKLSDCREIGCVVHYQCNTSVAIYNHNSPMYVANRGICICYSGKDICSKPPKESYKLGPGVYFFLGYSKKDEELLSKQANVTIADAFRHIERMAKSLWPKSCILVQYNQVEENLILQAYLSEFMDERENNSVTPEIVQKEEDVCATALRNISLLFEKEDPAVREHVALSMIKKTAVEVSKVPTGAGTTVLPECPIRLAALLFVMWAWRHIIESTEPPT